MLINRRIPPRVQSRKAIAPALRQRIVDALARALIAVLGIDITGRAKHAGDRSQLKEKEKATGDSAA